MKKGYFTKVAITLFLLGSLVWIDKCNDLEYTGQICLDSQAVPKRIVNIHYLEDVFTIDPAANFNFNVLWFKEGERKHQFLDLVNETSVLGSNYQNEQLEVMKVFQSGELVLYYDVQNILGDDPESRSLKKQFENGNGFYNAVRNIIRNSLEKKQVEEDLELKLSL